MKYLMRWLGICYGRAYAAAGFRAAIDIDIKICIYNNYTTKQFRDIFIAQIEAAYIYGHFLRGRKLKRFNKALQEYEQWGIQIFKGQAHTSDGVYSLTLCREGRDIGEELKNHLVTLYSFANYK